jgi:hypothetical protein
LIGPRRDDGVLHRFKPPAIAPTPQAQCTLLTKRKAYRRDTAVKVKLLLSTPAKPGDYPFYLGGGRE